MRLPVVLRQIKPFAGSWLAALRAGGAAVSAGAEAALTAETAGTAAGWVSGTTILVASPDDIVIVGGQ